jgi:hypothetical protein
MLDFYSDLNNARKERDEKYVEDQCIGEDLIEPDEKDIPGVNDYAMAEQKDYDLFDSGSIAEAGDFLGDLK